MSKEAITIDEQVAWLDELSRSAAPDEFRRYCRAARDSLRDASRFIYIVDEGMPELCLAINGAPCYELDRARLAIDSAAK